MASISDKEKLYSNLRRILARQPGSEAREQLQRCADELREKQSKLKLMKSELNGYTNKVDELKHSIDLLNKDLNLLKLEYFEKERNKARLAAAMEKFEDDENGEGSEDLEGGMAVNDENERDVSNLSVTNVHGQ